MYDSGTDKCQLVALVVVRNHVMAAECKHVYAIGGQTTESSKPDGFVEAVCQYDPGANVGHSTDADTAAEFAINRKDFNIVYPGKPDDLIKDDVVIKLKFNPKKG